MILYSRIKYSLPHHQKYLFSTSNSRPDYYQILGFCAKELESDHFEKIPDHDIKQQFYKQAKIYHPDAQFKTSKEAEIGTKMMLNEKFKNIMEAYEVLGDKEKRN